MVLRAKLRSAKANSRVQRAKISPESADFRPQWPMGGTEGRTDGRTDGRTEGRLEIHPFVLQDIVPLGPLPKKGIERAVSG